MEIHRFSALRKTDKVYIEFLRTRSLSAGVYTLEPGSVDHQSPHGEEEIYYVVAGKGHFSNGLRDEAVEAGTILYVDAKEPHRFHDITQALELLVFFAPPEGTQ